jgi:dTDP-4-dehydrorhamnose reductase
MAAVGRLSQSADGYAMKVLIVGCRGMLGTDLMEVMGPVYDMTGLDLPDLDITQSEQCLAKAQELRPEVIINAAAFTRVDACEESEKEAFLANAYGAGYLAKAAASVGSLFVHYSTDYIFDGEKSESYLEEDAPNPQSVYGKSKLLGETLIREHCSQHMILRTSWLFGRNGSNFIRTIVDAARKGTPLRVVNDQKGSPTYSLDLAVHTRMMIEAGCRATYHVTNRGSCTWHDLARSVLEWAGINSVPITPVATAEFPRPARRPANSILANSHLERDGLPPMRPWQVAAREYVERNLNKNS